MTPEKLPDLDALKADAEEYLKLFRKLSALSGATWARGTYRYHVARQRWSREQLLKSLRALRADDHFGAQLSIDATLSEANIQKGSLLARARKKTQPLRPTEKPDWSMPTPEQTLALVRDSMRTHEQRQEHVGFPSVGEHED